MTLFLAGAVMYLYDFQSFNYNGQGTYIISGNSSGSVVALSGGLAGNTNGALISGPIGNLQPLNVAHGNYNLAGAGISSSGIVYGEYSTSAYNVNKTFVNLGLNFTGLDIANASFEFIAGVNIDKNGQIKIVGAYQKASAPNFTSFSYDTSVYGSGSVTEISVPKSSSTIVSGINSSGTIVGTFQDALGDHVFSQTMAGAITKIDAPNASFYRPSGINDAGVIYGSYSDANGNYHGYVYNGSVSTFDIPNATRLDIYNVSQSGIAVGEYQTLTSGAIHTHGFVYQNGHVSSVDVPGSTDTAIKTITDTGQLIGNYSSSDGVSHGFTASLPVKLTSSAQNFAFKFSEGHFNFSDGQDILTAPDGSVFDVTSLQSLSFTDGNVLKGIGSPLLDGIYYSATNTDVWASHVDPSAHYNQYGWHEGRNPNALFSTSGYLAANADVAKAGLNPLNHYDQYGWKEGRDPSANFDNELYLLRNPDVKAAGIDPLTHYLQSGQAEGRQTYAAIGKASDFTHGSFDAEYYLLANADVAKAALNSGGNTFAFAFQHYQNNGWKEGRAADAYFDSAYYLAHNPDVAAAGINPLTHYDQSGWKEGRDPSAAFHTNAYLAANPDVAAAHIDPLTHYLQFGADEGRHLA